MLHNNACRANLFVFSTWWFIADILHKIQKYQILLSRDLMCGLTNLPYEVLANVADNLSFDDIFSLGRASKDFLFLLTEERICKSFVQVRAAIHARVIGKTREFSR